MSQQPKSPTLLDYFDREYLTRHPLSYQYAKISRWRLRRANKIAGRDLTLADLTAALIERVLKARADDPKRRKFYSETARLLRCLWRDAHSQGILHEPSPDGRKFNRGRTSGAEKEFASEPIPAGELALFDYFNGVYLPRVIPTRERQTKHLYRIALSWFSRYLGRRALVSDLNDEAIAAFMSWRIERGLSPHTVNKDRTSLVAIANYAAKKRVLAEFVAVKAINAPLDSPVCWRVEQIERLIKTASETPGTIEGAKAGDWWEAFHRVAWDTGERTGAILAIHWEWLDLETGWLRVPASVRKGKHKSMIYRLRPTTLDVLRRMAKPERDLVFSGVSVPIFYLRYTALLKRAGLPTGRRWKPQCMRRAFASYLEKLGHNATDALQHTSRNVTVNNYIDPTIATRTPASELLPELCSAGKDGAA